MYSRTLMANCCLCETFNMSPKLKFSLVTQFFYYIQILKSKPSVHCLKSWIEPISILCYLALWSFHIEIYGALDAKTGTAIATSEWHHFIFSSPFLFPCSILSGFAKFIIIGNEANLWSWQFQQYKLAQHQHFSHSTYTSLFSGAGKPSLAPSFVT